MASSYAAQKYLSSRGGSYDCSFEEVVIRGLAPDGGLFLPGEIPVLPADWSSQWFNWSFQELAFRIFSLYISRDEIPATDLRGLVVQSYSTFRVPDVAPLICLDEEKQLHLLELFHGPTFAFKDVALQFLGNLFEYFLLRSNSSRDDDKRDHLTVIGATSGDTGSAAIYGLRGKTDLSIIILHPKNRTSPVQEAQMTSVMDTNVHNLSVDGTFDDCQALVKDLFNDKELRRTHSVAAVNSINWARILAQITYYFHAYACLKRSGKLLDGARVRFIVPSGNFGNAQAGYFAKRMGLPIEKIVVGTNENDILDIFWKTGFYGKDTASSSDGVRGRPSEYVKEEAKEAAGMGSNSSGVRETYSPAMDILVSSNFERLLYFLALDVYGNRQDLPSSRATAGARVSAWLTELKVQGGFRVDAKVLDAARADFESERISDSDTLASIRHTYTGKNGTEHNPPYMLDPHTAVGVAAAYRSILRAPPPQNFHIALATAHPAKFASAVQRALEGEEGFVFEDSIPTQLKDLETLPKRKTEYHKSAGIDGLKILIRERVPASASSMKEV